VVPPLQLSSGDGLLGHFPQRLLSPGAAAAEQDIAAITATTNTSLARARQLLSLTSPPPPTDIGLRR
jgi:hypothetical protein